MRAHVSAPRFPWPRLGLEQRAWLEAELGTAQDQREQVIVLSHVVVHPEAHDCPGTTPWSWTTMLWDYEEALKIIQVC